MVKPREQLRSKAGDVIRGAEGVAKEVDCSDPIMIILNKVSQTIIWKK